MIMWKPVRCSKVDGRKFLALYQGDLGLHHLVWNGDHQILIKPEIGDIMVDATEEEAEKIYAKIDEMLNKAMTPSPMEKPKLQTKLKPEFAVSEVEAPKVEEPKPKAMSDFDLLTADIETI